MNRENPEEWSEDEKRLLRLESLVAECIKRREGSREKQGVSRWERFIESTGGAALITVLLGSIAGGYITARYQEGAKRRELELAAYNEYVKQEEAIVRKAYERIGSCISASEDLIALTRPEFQLSRFAGDDRVRVADQRGRLRERFNTADAEWRSERESLGLLMSYYHHGRPEVVEAWRAAQDAMTQYMSCARSWFVQHSASAAADDSVKGACAAEKELLRSRLDQLTRSFDASRVHAWGDSPGPPG
jgi:hypothetical protein